MNAIKTVKGLQDAVAEYAADCYDTVTTTKGLQFADGKVAIREVHPAGSLLPEAPAVINTPNDNGQYGVAFKLDAPNYRWTFDDKHCPEPLRSDLLNKLVEHRAEKSILCRSKGDVLRAVLSDQYTKFDHVKLVDLVAEAVATLGVEPVVARAEIGDDLRAYVVVPGVSFGKDPGAHEWTHNPDNGYGNGGLHPAVHIRNSEVGRGGVGINGAVWRSICTNGAIIGLRENGELFSRAHRGNRDLFGVLVAESLAEAFKLSEEASARLIASQEVHLKPVSLKPLVEGWASKYGLTIDARENWLQAVTSNAIEYGRSEDPRLFDVWNGATQVAQMRSPDERELVERMAGDLLYGRNAPLPELAYLAEPVADQER